MCPFRFASSCICSGQGYTHGTSEPTQWGPRKCGTYCGLFEEHSNQKVPSLVQCGPRVLPSGHSIELYSLLASRRSDPSHLPIRHPSLLPKNPVRPTPPPGQSFLFAPYGTSCHTPHHDHSRIVQCSVYQHLVCRLWTAYPTTLFLSSH